MMSHFKYLLMAAILGLTTPVTAQINLAQYPPYMGHDLGVNYAPSKTIFKLWSPTVDGVELKVYEQGDGGEAMKKIPFVRKSSGVWEAVLVGNWLNKFYTYQGYQINIDKSKKTFNEVPDIYAKAVGVNGKRGMIADLKLTDPKGWKLDKNPFKGGLNDAIIYELHVRDATKYTSAKYKGKFLGLTELGLTNKNGQPVGIDHLKQLGITHVQLLPCFDFFTVDESIADNPQYNWGYDPLNYNAPEGNYSTDPNDGNVRIKEFKSLIQALHKNGIAVIMDVVYNHTMFANESYLNQLVPNYYYRQNEKGGFSNASACSNETASERPMMRKFILESALYWMNEYHIDGFRFDLMAIHDIETMNIIAKETRKVKPNFILLGEGWTAGASPLKDEQKALKKNAYLMNNVAVFSDDIRDALKGSVFDHKDNGFISGKLSTKMSVQFGLVGAIEHPGINYANVNYSKAAYAAQPFQMIAYNECHDNHTLWDRLLNSNPSDDEKTRKKRYALGMAAVLLSQGVPFIHAGQEMCRTKKGEENSYKSSDDINAIDWERLTAFDDMHQEIKRLIALRKNYKAFRLGDKKKVQKQVQFETAPDGIIHMLIIDGSQEIHVILNASEQSFTPANAEKWQLLHKGYGGDASSQVAALGYKIFVSK